MIRHNEEEQGEPGKDDYQEENLEKRNKGNENKPKEQGGAEEDDRADNEEEME